jgi:hypothetical protein
MNIRKRLMRLETTSNDNHDFLPIIGLAVIDDLACDQSPLADWPDQVAGIRMFDGREWSRAGGEDVEAFRRRVSVEIGLRGPPGSLPHIVELILITPSTE